jgi:hypothetical protein
MENLTLNGFNNSWICNREAIGLSKCFEAYAENCSGSSIFEIGFNPNSGYVYIALEMERITICSMLGNDVEYLFTDFDNGEEFFFDNYEEAIEFDNKVTR